MASPLSPSQFFQQHRAQNPGATGTVAVFTHNLACPHCLAKGEEVPIKSRGSGFFCGKGHEWNDTESLMAEGPPPLSKPLPPKPRQLRPGDVEMRVIINSRLKEFLEKRYGVRLGASIEAILSVMADPVTFIISSIDVGRLSQHFGKQVRHADELVGCVYALRTERDQLRQEVEKMQTSPLAGTMMPASQGKVAVKIELDADTMRDLAEKARFRSQTLEQCLEQTILYGHKNGWF